jgi:hypothetical protein
MRNRVAQTSDFRENTCHMRVMNVVRISFSSSELTGPKIIYNDFLALIQRVSRRRIEQLWQSYRRTAKLQSCYSDVLSPNMCPFLEVVEAYVRWIEIGYSLMWPLKIPIVNEFIVGPEHPSFGFVRLVKSLDLKPQCDRDVIR